MTPTNIEAGQMLKKDRGITFDQKFTYLSAFMKYIQRRIEQRYVNSLNTNDIEKAINEKIEAGDIAIFPDFYKVFQSGEDGTNYTCIQYCSILKEDLDKIINEKAGIAIGMLSNIQEVEDIVNQMDRSPGIPLWECPEGRHSDGYFFSIMMEASPGRTPELWEAFEALSIIQEQIESQKKD